MVRTQPGVSGLDVGRAWVQGSSRDTASGDDRAFRPHAPTGIALGVTRRMGAGPVTLGLVASYGEGGLALDGPDLLLVDRTTQFAFYELAPLIGYRLTRLGRDGALFLAGGPAFSRWSLTDQPDRTRVGGRLALSLPLWFGANVGGALGLSGIVTPSVFEEGELPPEFVRTTTWRVEMTLGLVAGW